MKKNYFDTLQIYRGIAALLVVIHHTYTSFEHFKNLNIPILEFVAKVGKLGVDFFFVLSGFIIAYTTYNYRDNKGYLTKYFSARILRIYIPYLPISIALLILYAVYPQWSDSSRSISVLTSLTLIPHGNPALSVAWTLVFEMFFYIVYSINFFSKKSWFIFLTFWILSILISSIIGWKSDIALVNIFTNLYNLEFIAGVLVAYLIKSKYKPNYPWLITVAFALLSVFLIIKYFEISPFAFSQNILFTITASMFVIIAVYFWNKPIRPQNIFMLLGNSSYSLYLLHNPMQSFLVRLFPKINGQLIIFLEFLLVIVCISGVSYLYYFIFEKKLIVFFKRKIDSYFA